MATDPSRAESLERLPLPYATALRLRDVGIADEVIADRVGVDLDALATFMRLAEAKLAAASERPPTQPSGR
jgi:DNA-directed RNA polymerase specialized sigma24 family protein